MSRHVDKLLRSSELGWTIDGKLLFPGVVLFYLKDTLGLPLNVQLDELAKVGCVPNWKEWVQAGLKAGWTPDKIFKEGFYSVQDSEIYPREQHKEFETMLRYLVVIESEKWSELSQNKNA